MLFKILIFVFVILIITSLLAYFHGSIEYDEYIKKLANKHTIEEINKKISDDDELLEKKYFKGIFLDSIRDHKEMWEQVKKYKLNNMQ